MTSLRELNTSIDDSTETNELFEWRLLKVSLVLYAKISREINNINYSDDFGVYCSMLENPPSTIIIAAYIYAFRIHHMKCDKYFRRPYHCMSQVILEVSTPYTKTVFGALGCIDE